MNISAFLLNATACIKVAGAESPTAPGQTLPDDQMPVVTDLRNGLAAIYLVDEGDRLTYVQRHHLAAINGEPKALHEVGLLNLSKLAQDKLRIVSQGGVHGLLLDGLFEASLLLLDDLWDGPLASHTPNGPVIAIPTRDVLAFCDAKSAQGIDQLHQLCERTMAGNDHVLTATLYRRERGEWHPTA